MFISKSFWFFFSSKFRWSLNGKLFASAGSDGNIKLWDGVSNRCINTFTAAHDGAEISSVCFTRNSKVYKFYTYNCCRDNRFLGIYVLIFL